MLKYVIRHELRLMVADRVAWSVAALFLLFFAYGVINGVSWARFQSQTLENLGQEENERLESVSIELAGILAGAEPSAPWTDPRAPSVLGGARGSRHAALPPGPLTALAVGQSDLLPYYYTVSIWTNDQTFLQNGEVENPANLMTGRFDLAFLILYLLPLLILGLNYNILSGEREAGTLALTLSQPVALAPVLRSRLAVRAAVVLAVATGISILGGLMGVTGDANGVWGRLGIWVVAVTAYSLFWFALSLAVNALGRSSSWNALALVGAWLALVVVIPAGLNVVADVLHPLPSRVEMVTAQREASDEAVRERTALLARYYEDHPEMAQGTPLDTANTAAAGYAAQEEVNRRMAEIVDRYDMRLRAQHEVVSRYRFLSPALLAQQVLNDAAGTGDARFEHFRNQVARFADEWKAFFVPPLLAGRSMTPSDVEASPQFRYEEEELRVVSARSITPLGALFLLCAGLATFATRRLRRHRMFE